MKPMLFNYQEIGDTVVLEKKDWNRLLKYLQDVGQIVETKKYPDTKYRPAAQPTPAQEPQR